MQEEVKQPELTPGSTQIPEWIDKAHKQSLIIQAFKKVFEANCNCDVCQMLREGLKASAEMPIPKEIGK